MILSLPLNISFLLMLILSNINTYTINPKYIDKLYQNKSFIINIGLLFIYTEIIENNNNFYIKSKSIICQY